MIKYRKFRMFSSFQFECYAESVKANIRPRIALFCALGGGLLSKKQRIYFQKNYEEILQKFENKQKRGQ